MLRQKSYIKFTYRQTCCQPRIFRRKDAKLRIVGDRLIFGIVNFRKKYKLLHGISTYHSAYSNNKNYLYHLLCQVKYIYQSEEFDKTGNFISENAKTEGSPNSSIGCSKKLIGNYCYCVPLSDSFISVESTEIIIITLVDP